MTTKIEGKPKEFYIKAVEVVPTEQAGLPARVVAHPDELETLGKLVGKFVRVTTIYEVIEDQPAANDDKEP